MVNVAFKVTEAWHRRVKAAAGADNRSMVRYIVQAVEEKMARDAQKAEGK
jgi:hypothetical protein